MASREGKLGVFLQEKVCLEGGKAAKSCVLGTKGTLWERRVSFFRKGSHRVRGKRRKVTSGAEEPLLGGEKPVGGGEKNHSVGREKFLWGEKSHFSEGRDAFRGRKATFWAR